MTFGKKLVDVLGDAFNAGSEDIENSLYSPLLLEESSLFCVVLVEAVEDELMNSNLTRWITGIVWSLY